MEGREYVINMNHMIRSVGGESRAMPTSGRGKTPFPPRQEAKGGGRGRYHRCVRTASVAPPQGIRTFASPPNTHHQCGLRTYSGGGQTQLPTRCKINSQDRGWFRTALYRAQRAKKKVSRTQIRGSECGTKIVRDTHHTYLCAISM